MDTKWRVVLVAAAIGLMLLLAALLELAGLLPAGAMLHVARLLVGLLAAL